MRKTLLLLLALFSIQLSNAQSWSWARTGTSGGGAAKTVTTDASGNVYIAGNFDDGHITFGSTTLNYAGQTDAFITKYDPLGNVLWAKSAGGTGPDYISAMCTDNNGNLYVTGYHASYSFSLGGISLTGYNGAFNVFVAKYDSNGNAIWANTSNVCTCDNLSNAITVDSSGNVYITGNFNNGSITFGSYTLTNGISNGTNTNLFLAKFDASGNHVWAKKAGGADIARSKAVCVDPSGNVYITGMFRNVSISFDGITLTPTPAGQYDCFIAKYDPSGNAVWAKSNSGTDEDAGNAIVSDASGNIYVTGYYNSRDFSLSGSALPNSYPTGIPHENGFLAKYTNGGNLTWLRSMGGTGGRGEVPYAITPFNDGVYLSGRLGSASTGFGPFTLVPGALNYDPLFLAAYNVSGNVIYATSLDAGASITNSLRADRDGNVYVTGQFHYTVNPFNIGATGLTPGGIETVFVAKLSAAFATTPVTLSRFSVTPMDDQLDLSWRTEQEVNIDGYYIQKFNSGNNSFENIAYVPSRRTSYANEYSFTDRNVQPNILYQYRLAVLENGTVKQYSPVRTGKLTGRASFVFRFANPVKDRLEIQFTSAVDKAAISVRDNAGHAVYSNTHRATGNVLVDMSNLSPGIYFLTVSTNDQQVTRQFLKQ